MKNEKTVLVELLVKLRDAASEALDSLTPEEIKEQQAVSEANFDLAFTEYSSPKLGTYEVTDEKANNKEKFLRALKMWLKIY